jgi:branched-chain amino acid transport system permease protein
LASNLNIEQATVYVYFLMIGMSLFTIFVVNRLQDSRIGRAWIALVKTKWPARPWASTRRKTKLMAFALGATWAGMGGVVFAAKTTFINPASFTIWESIIILCVVVLGGHGIDRGGY